MQEIFFSHLLKGEVPNYTLMGQKLMTHTESDCVQWGTVMASGMLYAANLGVDREEGLNLGTNDFSGMLAFEINTSEEDKFLKQVGNLVMQVA